MSWEKKKIETKDMMHFLGVLYGMTAAEYKKVGLQTLIETRARQPVVAKCRPITKAILESGILLKKGYGSSLSYKWNLKEVGVPSIPMADMLIEKTASVLREDKRETRRRYKEKQNYEY